MKRIKKIAVLLAVALLIVFVAYLPIVVAVLQDRNDSRQIRYAQSSAVQLEIREALTIMEKLALIRSLDGSIEIAEDDAAMTRSEVHAAAYAAFEQYYASGLMLPIEETYSEFHPLLATDASDPEKYGIIWSGQIVQETEPYPVVELGIDDETGKLLYIHYNAGKFIYDDSELISNLQIFSEIYFSNLGIADYPRFGESEIFYGDNINGIRYCFEDESCGEITVEFYSFGSGFYVSFL